MADKRKILITGVTGYIGQQLLSQLDFNKFNIYCLVRDLDSEIVHQLTQKHTKITWLTGDITKPKSLSVPKQVEVLIHIAALTNAPKDVSDPWSLFKQVNIDGTSNILRAMPAALKQVVLISSVDAAGSLQQLESADENIPLQPNTHYDVSKLASEKIVKDLSEELGFEYTIIRPSMVFGPGESNPEMFKINTLIALYFKLIRMGVFPMFGWGQNKVPLVSVRDVNQVISRSILHSKAYGETFNAVSGFDLTFRKLIREMKTIANPSCVVLPIPLVFLKPSLKLFEMLVSPLGITLPITAKGVTYLTTSRSYDSSKAEDLLGYQPTPMQQTLQEMYSWLHSSEKSS